MVQSLLKGIGETETEQRCISLTAPTFTQVEWNFGPVTCRRLYLDGVDVPLTTDTGTLGLMYFDLDQESVPKSVPKSVLEVVVDNNRLDILSQGTCLNIVQRKWDKCVLQVRPHFISFLLLPKNAMPPYPHVVFVLLACCISFHFAICPMSTL